MSVGPATAGEPVPFLEIESWSRQTGRRLDAWEAEMLHRLSGAYLSEYHAAKARDRPPPAGEVAKAKPTRSEVSQLISDLFARLEAKHAAEAA